MWFIVGHPQGSIIENGFGESAGSMLLMLSGRHGFWGEGRGTMFCEKGA